MTIAVLGLWHLGSVTAACAAAAGFTVRGWDPDPAVVAGLAAGTPPLFEPGLESLVAEGLAAGRLSFTSEVAAAVDDADIVWITLDTPVDEDDYADVEFVVRTAAMGFPHLRDAALVLVSSQLPVGTTARLAAAFAAQARGRRVSFAYSPENLRLGKAIAAFTTPDRVVVGVADAADRARLAALFAPWTTHIEWMSVESAEMAKHALNAFLATSVSFINEIAVVCEQVGADAGEVARALKSEPRIGPRAYLSPGAAFAGGTLARDIRFLSGLGATHGVGTQLLESVRASNDTHKQWAARRLDSLLGGVSGRTVAIWGLAYTTGTDTLRRSTALEMCRWLADHGAAVRVHDPAVRGIPDEHGRDIEQVANAVAALDAASALIVATPWPEYRDVAPSAIVERMARPLVLDPARHLEAVLAGQSGIEYITVGVTRR